MRQKGAADRAEPIRAAAGLSCLVSQDISMTIQPPRRRVLCVRPRGNPTTPAFMLGITSEWLDALRLHCEVIVMERDFDLAETCDQVRPDLLLFECTHPERPSPITITNARAHPHLPRAALMMSDPHDSMRPLTYQFFEAYGVETVFTFSTTHRQQMPELAHVDCFSLSLFVDREVFHDYGLQKIIPVSIFGGHLMPKFYPWRAAITPQIQQRLPTLIYTHPGYGANPSHAFPVQDEAYARLLNQSFFSLADTTCLDYVVRKHLEIPAAGAVLVSPDTRSLAEYGFVDMQNCILGSGDEVFAKLDAVSRDRSLYQSIQRAGYDLVQARYTRQAWRWIPEWLECRLQCRPGQVVRQQGLLGPFVLQAEHPATASIANHVDWDTPLANVLRAARSVIMAGGPLEVAEAGLHEVASWVGHMAEPWVLLGIAALLRGNPGQARQFFLKPVEMQQARHSYHQIEPQFLVRLDPVEMAWLLLTASLTDDTALVQMIAPHLQGTRHLSLRRMLWLLEGGDMATARGRDLDARLPDDRLSIHWSGQEDFGAWRDLMRRIFIANGKLAAAGALSREPVLSPA